MSIKKGVGSLQFLEMERILNLKCNRKGVQTEKRWISPETSFKILFSFVNVKTT